MNSSYKKSERFTGLNLKNSLNSIQSQHTIYTETETENCYYSSNLISKPRPFNSCINTLNDSGNPGSGIDSPFTIAS